MTAAQKLKVKPGAQQWTSDMLPQQIQALYSAQIFSLYSSKAAIKKSGKPESDFRVVIEWAWQSLSEEVPEDEFASGPWIMHIWVVMYQREAEHSFRLGMFEADSTERIENISFKEWQNMEDGGTYPGFCTEEYTAVLEAEHGPQDDDGVSPIEVEYP